MIALLAQSSSGSGSVVLWLSILVVVLVVGLALALKVKAWLLGDDVPEQRAGFTLSDLRRMHKEGRMTDEEFEKAKSLLIGSVKAATNKPPVPPPIPRKRPPPGDFYTDGPR